MIAKVKMEVPEPLYDALLRSADTNLRSVHNEALYIVRQELTRRGLLSAESKERNEERHAT